MVHTTSSPKLMSAQTCTDAVAALARLAAADPYTAVEACGLLPAGLSHHSAPTAISATKPPTTIKQASSPMQLSPQQSTASALHLLQQLLASPASSNDSTSDGEVNSRAISASQASGVRSNTRTQVQRPVLTTAAETVRGPDRPSRLQARGSPVATADTLAPTAGSFEELLLRRCVAALLSWQRIAALETKRTSLLAHHLRQQHQLRSVRLAFQAWRDAAAVATAQSSFVMQLLSVEDRAMLAGSLRAWRAQCHVQYSVSSKRAEERMQNLRQAMTAWQQWRLFKHYQGTAATAFHRRQLVGRVLHCWRSEWLVKGRAKRQLAKQQQYKIQFLQGRWKLLRLHSILASWSSIAAAQAAARAHLSRTLQHVHKQQLLQAWCMATRERLGLKQAAIGAWKEHVRWHRRKPRMLTAALQFQRCRQVLVHQKHHYELDMPLTVA
ncbi:hypothetical protein ABBQ38_011589 [Trebouxia sp. C0009 RCD-2024]